MTLTRITPLTLHSMTDHQLLRRLVELTQQSRRVESELVAHVAEVDARRLYLGQACSSMFAYCTEVLCLSEAEAYLRITAARAARQHPVLLDMLADGRLHLSGIARLARHLTAENRDAVLHRTAHKTRLEIEELVAELAPKPDAAAVIRKLPAAHSSTGAPSVFPSRTDAAGTSPRELCLDRVESPGTGSYQRSPAAPRASSATIDRVGDVVQPLAPGRYRVQFTASAQLRDKLERLRALTRSSVPDGDLATVIEAAVTEKLQRLEARRFATTAASSAATRAPRRVASASPAGQTSRHLPAAVRRAVWERDGGRCRYVGEDGRRCSARERLEFHHRHPYGHGGDHAVENISLQCHAHNQYLADLDYGARARRPPVPARCAARRSPEMPPPAAGSPERAGASGT